jgi:hypothetical protein
VDPARGCGRIGNETGRARLSALLGPTDGGIFSVYEPQEAADTQAVRSRQAARRNLGRVSAQEIPVLRAPKQRDETWAEFEERQMRTFPGIFSGNGPVAFTRPGPAAPVAADRPAPPRPPSEPQTDQ